MAVFMMPTCARRGILPRRSEKSPVDLARLLVASAALCLTLSAASPAIAQSSYTVEDLGTLPGDSSSVAWGINANGDVVGWSTGPNGTRGFVYSNLLKMVALPGLPNRPRSLARDINDAGDIVGSANAGGTDVGHAVIWKGGIAQDLGTLGGAFSEGWGINNIGQAVGTAGTSDGKVHGFVYTPGNPLADLTPNSDQGAATDINDAGQITGYKTAFGGYHAFRWNGSFLDLGVLPGFAHSFGWAINLSGQVAGSSTTASGNSERLIRFTDGSGLQDLGGSGEHNTAWGINASGLVVGCRGQSLKRAVRYTNTLGLQELNALIDPSLGWVLLCAHDVNDAGQIVGYGFNNYTGLTHAVRLQPLASPPPECTVNCLRSTKIVLRERATGGVKGVVTVRNEKDALIAGALVVAEWTYPDGSTVDHNAWTDAKGKARFVITSAQSGTFTLRIVNIVLSQYTFNPSRSVLTKSITVP
jgi:probable HAF family extracellular repeat protein